MRKFMDSMAGPVVLMIGVFGMAIVFSLLLALPVMWLWNVALVPAVAGLSKIGFWQAAGIMVLCAVLFKSTIAGGDK
jgi:hypothetical protein